MDLDRVIAEHSRSGDRSRSGRTLKPLSATLTEERVLFVEPLRALFRATGMTFSEFGSLHGYSNASMSRFMSGERVPGDYNFVSRLVETWLFQNNAPNEVADEIEAELTERQEQDLRTSDNTAYKKLKASQEMAAAVHQREEAARQVRKLSAQLETLEQERDSLRLALEEIGPRASRAAELQRRAATLAADAQRTEKTIAQLKRELAAAKEAQAKAEALCRELERELVTIEDELEREKKERAIAEQRLLAQQAEKEARKRLQEIDEAKAEAMRDMEQARGTAQMVRETIDLEKRSHELNKQHREREIQESQLRTTAELAARREELGRLTAQRDALAAEIAKHQARLDLMQQKIVPGGQGASYAKGQLRGRHARPNTTPGTE